MPKNSSINITFDQTIGVDSLYLFEVTEEMLTNLTKGQIFILRGQDDDESVLCTEDATYNLRLVENSNTCLMINPQTRAVDIDDNNTSTKIKDTITTSTITSNKSSMTVTDIVTCHYDLVRIAPKLQRLRTLFQEKPLDEESDQILLKTYLSSLISNKANKRQKTSSTTSTTSTSTSSESILSSSNIQNTDHSFDSKTTDKDMEIDELDGYHIPRVRKTVSTIFQTDNIPTLHKDSPDTILPRPQPHQTTISTVSGYPLADLRGYIQCSEGELRNALRTLPAVYIENVFVGLDTKYLGKVSMGLLDIIASGVVAMDIISNTTLQLNANECIKMLSESDKACSPATAATTLSYHLDIQSLVEYEQKDQEKQKEQDTTSTSTSASTSILTGVYPALLDYYSLSQNNLAKLLTEKNNRDSTINDTHSSLHPLTWNNLYCPQVCFPDYIHLSLKSMALVMARALLSQVNAVISIVPTQNSNTNDSNQMSQNTTAANNTRLIPTVDYVPFERNEFLNSWSSTLPVTWISYWTENLPKIEPTTESNTNNTNNTNNINSSNPVLLYLENMLKGIAVLVPPERIPQSNSAATAAAAARITQKGRQGYVLLEEYELPLDIRQRFQLLFTIKPQWEKRDIQPYIEILSKHGYGSIEQILLKETRAVKVDGISYHMSRL